MPLRTEVGLGPGDIMLDKDPATPLPKRGGTAAPHFAVYVYFGQTAGWINMSLGMEIGLGPGHIVLDEDPATPPPKGAQQRSTFRPVCCRQTAGWIKMLLGTEVGVGPCYIVLDGDPRPPEDTAAPNFWPVSIVVKRLDGSRCHLIGI